ncbi:unnamed protein product, partial [Linum tenue]
QIGSLQADAISAQVSKHAVTVCASFHDRDGDIFTSLSKARAWAATTIRVGLSPVFSLGQNLPPDLGCIPKQPDSQTSPRGATGSGHDGALTLSSVTFQGTWAQSAAEDASPDYNSSVMGVRFSTWAFPGWLAVTKGILLATASSADDFIFGQPQGSSETPGGQHPLPSPRGDGTTLRDTQADVPSTGRLPVQLAFKDTMVHGNLQFIQVSHFATFFIDVRAEISVVESHYNN